MGRLLGTIVAVAIALSPAGAARAQDKLVVWWNKGFYEAEDKTIQAAIAKWEQQSGTRVELSLFSLEDIVTKTVSAVAAGSHCRRSGIARGRADDRHMSAMSREHRIEHQPDKLQSQILKGKGRPVK